MTPPPGVRPSETATSFLYAYWRFQEIYLSAIWATGVTMVPTFVYWWAQRKHYLPRSHAVHRMEGKVMLCLFVAAFLLVLYRYVRPDWRIWRRLKRAASSQGLELQSQANGVAIDWIWATCVYPPSRLPGNGQSDSEAPSLPLPFGLTATDSTLLGSRCWILSTEADPSRLLLVTHTPKACVAGLATGRGSRTIEIVSVMCFRQEGSDRAPFPPATHERLTRLGFKILEAPEGLRVSKIRANGRGKGQAAMDQVQSDEVIELWRLCSAVSA